MNRTEIEAKWNTLTPRERDAWVAEVVFGVPVQYEYSPRGPVYLDKRTLMDSRTHIRNYTTNLNAAMVLLDTVSGELYIYRENPTFNFVVSFGYSTEECSECGEDEFEVEAQGKGTLPEAICLAALIAKLTDAAEVS